MITLLPGQTDFLATMYSFGAMLSFTIAHVSVIRLRQQQVRGRARPWKPPLNFRAFGFEVPLTAVLGGLGTFAAWIVVMALNPTTLAVGGGWMVFGIARLRPLPPQPGAAADRDGQGRDAGAARGRGGRVPQRPGRLRGRRAVLRGDGRHRGQARLQAAPRHPRPLDARPFPATCRSTPRCREQEAEAQSKIEQAKLIGGHARHRPRRAGRARPGRLLDRRGGGADQGARRS